MSSPNRNHFDPERLADVGCKPEWLRFVHPALATDDKYSRGVVGLVTGSEAYPGAAVLGVTAAIRFGVGLVRLVAADAVAAIVLAARPEVVRAEIDADAADLPRCNAWVVGSGVAADATSEAAWLNRVLASDVPVVLDAGALEVGSLEAFAGRRILTPHTGEAVRLLARFGVESTRADIEQDAVGVAQQLANLSGAIVLLKGNRTVVAAPDGVFWRAEAAPSELATAGTGDVLAGVLGAILATNPGEDLFELAQFGVWLHSRAAAELAASGPIAALDLADQLRHVVGRLTNGGADE
ncbi:MAG: NAD(P)H-hydrate dehydratase [Micrococcales bacterium]